MGVCTAKNYHFFYEVPNLFNQRSNFAFNLHVVPYSLPDLSSFEL